MKRARGKIERSSASTSPVAVITGASGGIGSAVVKGLLAQGFRVVATDVSRKALVSLSEIPGPAKNLKTFLLDVTQQDEVKATADVIMKEWGRVDVLVNNAGVFRRTPILGMDVAAAETVLKVNLLGTLSCMAVFGRLMAGARRGRIINMASISGTMGAALASAYAASKAGVIAATYSAARELAPYGISVNAIAPGYCDTPMLTAHRAPVEKFVVPRIPLGRVGRADEIAELVVFLATCRTDYMTGSTLSIDGGLSVG